MDQQNSESSLKEGLNVQTPEPAAQPENKPKKKSKKLLLVIILLVVLVWGGTAVGVMLLNKDSNTNENVLTNGKEDGSSSDSGQGEDDPYEGWKTYIILDDKYEIKFPSNWRLDSDSKDQSLSGDTSVMAIFSNVETEEQIAIGNFFQTGEIGHIGGCDIGLGESGSLYQIIFIGEKEVDVEYRECYSEGELSARTINVSETNAEVYDHSISVGMNINDTTSTVEELKEKYKYVGKILESMQLVNDSSQSTDPY